MAEQRLGVGITHAGWINERRLLLQRNLPALEREGLPHVVAQQYDENPNRSVWKCIKFILANARARDWTHVLILADDMRPALGAGAALRWMLAEGMDYITPFHMPPSFGENMEPAGRRWAYGSYNLGSAVLLPVERVTEWMSWAETTLKPILNDYPEDSIMAAWANRNGIKWWIPVPALFQHEMPHSSVYGHPSKRKVAGLFYEDVTGVDWTQGRDDPARMDSDRSGGIKKYLKDRGL